MKAARMRHHTSYVSLVAAMLAALIATASSVLPLHAAQQDDNPGQGAAHRTDPCDQIPDPPGKARGHDKKCPARGSSSGVSMGDFNGDGWADLAIGEPDADVGSKASAGDVIVIYGSANGLTTSSSTIPGRQLWYEGRTPGTAETGDHFGSALASGDFNMDGKSDLAIGIPGKTTARGGPHGGAIVVIYGSATGLTTTDRTVPSARMFDLSQAVGSGVTLKFDNAGLGSSLAWGDFDGDGVGDLAAGAPKLSVTQCAFFLCSDAPEIGGVWEIFGIAGATGGLAVSRNHVFLQSDPFLGVGSFFDGDKYSHFGQSLAAGDFNGDGHSDLAIGVPDESISFFRGFFTPEDVFAETGTVEVYLGGPVGLIAVLEQRWSEDADGIPGALESNDHFGAALVQLRGEALHGDGRHRRQVVAQRNDRRERHVLCCSRANGVHRFRCRDLRRPGPAGR